MDTSFTHSQPLRHFARQMNEWHNEGWLFVRSDCEITLDMPCFLANWDDTEFSPEEQDQLNECLKRLGMRRFLEWGQLSDIIGNLEEQRVDFTDADLEKAILYYWRRDAFINFTSLD